MSDKEARVKRRAAKRAKREEAQRLRDAAVPPPPETRPMRVPESIRNLSNKIRGREG